MTGATQQEHQTAWLATLLDSSNDAIVGVDAGGVIVSWNAGAVLLYGYGAEEILGQRASVLVPLRARAETERMFADLRTDAEPRSFEGARLTKSGDERTFAVKLALVPVDSDRGAAVVCIERELPRTQSLERQLLRARRLEAVDRLVSGVAQEFNNVHTAILSLAEFVAGAVSTGAPARSDLDEIARQAMRGTQLARHLMALSADPPVARQAEVPNTVIRQLEPQLRQSVGERVRFSVELAAADESSSIDPLALELILLELTRHAARSIGVGSVVISTDARTFLAGDTNRPADLPAGSYYRVAIRAKTAALTTIQAASQPTADLALALAETAAAKLNGFITARATDTELSWTLYIPEVPTSSGAVLATADPAAEEPLGTILVVEDEAPVRDVICRVLSTRGYSVLSARNGEDALAVASRHGAPIHLVVSDIVMPEMDGAVLFDHLRAWYPTLRFILISGYTRGALRAEQFKDVITEFLPKPFGMDELLQAVDTMLGRAAA